MMAALAFIAAVLCSAALTGIEIPFLKKKQFGQFIREEGPESHQSKAGTPTMGGVALYGACTIVSIIFAILGASSGVRSGDVFVMVAAGLMFGLIGFIDDFIKVAKKHNLGLTALQKIVLQVVFAALLAIYMMRFTGEGTLVWIPLVNEYVDFGALYVPFIVFVMVAMANSVNLTDGLDGLCAGVTGIVSLFFVLIAVSLSNASSAVYLAALAGACMGFLFWNRNPAKIFMGDTGSMALGLQ